LSLPPLPFSSEPYLPLPRHPPDPTTIPHPWLQWTASHQHPNRKRPSLVHTSVHIPYVAEPSADLNIRYVTLVLPSSMRACRQPLSLRPRRCHMPSPVLRPVDSTNAHTSPFPRLVTSARIQAKNHSVAHSPHAKSVSPAPTSSLVMRGYTVTITVRPLLAGLVKRTRRLYPLLMAGTMRMLLSPGELRKRRLGAEQTATMRCVLSISILALLCSLLMPGMCHPRSPMLAPSIPQDAQAHLPRCQPMLSLLHSPRCQA